jgi:hypothetical protein
MWGALSDEKTGLSFTIAAGPSQRSHTKVRVPWNSWPYFAVSDSRLPFLSLPTTRRAAVEVFLRLKVKVTLRLTVSQSVSLGVEPHLGLMTKHFLLFDIYGLVFGGLPLWREDGSVMCRCCWPLPAQSFSGPSPLGLATEFYCLRFETSLFVGSYDSQGHGGGIRPRLHTGLTIYSLLCLSNFSSFISSGEPYRNHRLQGFQYCVCLPLESLQLLYVLWLRENRIEITVFKGSSTVFVCL